MLRLGNTDLRTSSCTCKYVVTSNIRLAAFASWFPYTQTTDHSHPVTEYSTLVILSFFQFCEKDLEATREAVGQLHVAQAPLFDG